MLHNFPRRYDDYTQLKPTPSAAWLMATKVTVIGTVHLVNTLNSVVHFQITEAVITDGTGYLVQPTLDRKTPSPLTFVLSGKIDQYLGRLVMNSPETSGTEKPAHKLRVPVYPLTSQH